MTDSVIFIDTKCRDMASIYGCLDGRGFCHDGYPLPVPNLMGGDYISFGIDIETGKIMHWDKIKEPLIKALHNDEVVWEELT